MLQSARWSCHLVLPQHGAGYVPKSSCLTGLFWHAYHTEIFRLRFEDPALTRREQEIPLFYKWGNELRLTRRFFDF